MDSDEFPFEKQGQVVAAVADQDWTLRGWDRVDDVPRAENAPGLVLFPATPNPFNPTTTLAFDLPVAAAVDMMVYDLQGRLARTILAGDFSRPAVMKKPGTAEITPAGGCPAGRTSGGWRRVCSARPGA